VTSVTVKKIKRPKPTPVEAYTQGIPLPWPKFQP
jgi:hypothetical protein